VRWDDITRARADVYAVGHYQGVLPQNAELALDRAISGESAGESDLVLTQLTRRGVLRGALGDVNFYPILAGPAKGRVVAVAGMAHPGAFGAPELRRVTRTLAAAIGALPHVERVCTVLIGGGAGNLPVRVAAASYVLGFLDGLDAAVRRSRIRELVIVESQLDKAYDVQGALEELRGLPDLASRIEVLPIDVPADRDGAPGDPFCRGVMLAAAAQAARSGAGETRRALERLLGSAKELRRFRRATLESLREIPIDEGTPLARVAASIGTTLRERGRDHVTAPTRLSFVREPAGIVAAALTDTVVKPERLVPLPPYLLDGLVREMTEPEPRQVPELSQRLGQFVIPRDFRELVSRERPTIFEVDRTMASVHWEMLASRLDGGVVESRPLGLVAPVARQLRTSYSPPPGAAPPQRGKLRALVIGDPGDPRKGHSLPGASEEAFAVADVLRAKGAEVELLVGAPSAPRTGRLANVEPASRYALVTRLVDGGYHLLHYAGHAAFEAERPQDAGWLFEGGILTAAELEIVNVAPRLVVANACLSGRTSNVYRGGANGGGGRLDADLLPGLADAFFARGVRNYVGTAWEVNDLGAVEFAKVFYGTLLSSERRATIGEALVEARKALAREERRFGTLWAAYQHYGDPLQTMTTAAAASEAGGRPAARRPRSTAARSGGAGKPARASARVAGRRRSRGPSNRRS
jgi:hypothetical protein